MIKTLARSIREYKRPAILTPILVSFEVVLECIIPYVIASLVNAIKAGCDLPTILQYGAVLILMAILSLSFGAAAGFTCSTASCGLARNLRHDMFCSIQNYSFQNIDKFMTSSLVTRMTTDITNVQMAYMMIIRTAIRAPLMLIFAFVMAFVMGGKMAWIFVFVLPVLGFGLFLIAYNAMPLFRRVFRKYDRLNNSIQENIKGIRVVKSFVRQDKEVEKFTDVSGTLYRDFSKAERIMAFNSPLMSGAVYACIISISWLGANMIVSSGNTTFTTGNLTSMFTYTTQILSGLMMLSMVFVMLTMNRAPMKRCCELLSEEPQLHSPENPVTEVPDGSIVMENVSFRYSEKASKNTLDGLNISIAPGMTVGILGGTGSGKSTLVQLIPRLYDVCEGTVKVGGIDVREYDLKALRDQVAMVLQKNVLFSGTIKENLRWGNPDATDEQMEWACRLACAHDFITAFPDGYDTHIEQGGKNVSGGQKQRLCIARALLKNPKILILDDSTSAVDTQTDASIRRSFREEIPGVTKLIIAQRVASVQDADLILVMDGGTVVAQGTHEALLETSNIYREVYESQIKGGEE